MANKTVRYCTTYKPVCAFVPNAPVIICLEDSALVVQPDPECLIAISTIEATICSTGSYQSGCNNWTYQYTFEYDDAQLVDPDRGLLQEDITGFFCDDCLVTYVDEQISCIATERIPLVVIDTATLDLTVSGPGDHTLQGDVNVSADAGNIITIEADGLYAVDTPISVTDTSSIDLTVSGLNDHTLSGVVRISATSGNLISINPDGLFGTQTSLSVVDTATLDLSVSGTANHTLTGSVKISSVSDNAISAQIDGIYAPDSVTSVNVGSGCNTVGASNMVRTLSVAGTVLNLTSAPEHTSDVFYQTTAIAALGALGVGTHTLGDISYTRTADACRGTCFTEHYGQVSNVDMGVGSAVTVRTLSSINGGAFTFNSESVYTTPAAQTLPLADYSRANPSTTIAAAGVNESIVVRFQLIVVAAGTGVTHNGSDIAASSLRTTR